MSQGSMPLPIKDRSGVLFLEDTRLFVQSQKLYMRDKRRKSETVVPYLNLAIIFVGRNTEFSSDVLKLLHQQNIYLHIIGSQTQPTGHCMATRDAQMRFQSFIQLANDADLYSKNLAILTSERCHFIDKMTAEFAKKYFPDDRDAQKKIDEMIGKVQAKMSSDIDLDEIRRVRSAFDRNFVKLYAAMAGIQTKEAFQEFLDCDAGGPSEYALVKEFMTHGRELAEGFARTALSEIGIPAGISLFPMRPDIEDILTDVTQVMYHSVIVPRAFYYGLTGSSSEDFRKDIFETFASACLIQRAGMYLTEILRKNKNHM